jgi:hypothetical protein
LTSLTVDNPVEHVSQLKLGISVCHPGPPLIRFHLNEAENKRLRLDESFFGFLIQDCFDPNFEWMKKWRVDSYSISFSLDCDGDNMSIKAWQVSVILLVLTQNRYR